MRDRTAPLRSFAKSNGKTAQRASQEDCRSCPDSKAPSTGQGLSTFRSRARITQRQIGGGINVSGSFASPPDSIAAGSTFTVNITNNGDGRNFDIDAVLASASAGRFTISPLTAQFIASGTSASYEFVISSGELEGVPDGSYTLEIVVEETFGTDSALVASTGVEVGGGGGGGGATGSLSLSNVRLERSPVAGESLRLIVDVTNDTTADASFDIEYSLNGRTEDSETISGAFAHPAGATLQYSGSITPEAGSNEACVTLSNVSAGGTSLGSVGPQCIVFNAEEISPGQPNVSVDGFDVAQGPLSPGQNITVDVRFRNTGDAGGQASSSVLFNGSVVGTASTQVPAGSTATASVTAPVPDTSELTVSVQGFTDTITRAVGTAGGGGGGDGGTGGGGQQESGLGLGALLAGLAAVIFFAFGRS